MQGGLPKFTELLMKCIWRNVKVMPEKANELDCANILHEIHEFMQALPSIWWAQRPVDTPLRTVKTIIHNMAKLKGKGILQHLSGIPPQSELNGYLLRVLKVCACVCAYVCVSVRVRVDRVLFWAVVAAQESERQRRDPHGSAASAGAGAALTRLDCVRFCFALCFRFSSM